MNDRFLLAGRNQWLAMPAWILGALALATQLVGCPGIDAKSTQYAGVQHFSPTDPSSVEILRQVPARMHEKRGEIRVEASTDPASPIGDIENKLREEGAKLGANAVVIVYDRIQPAGATIGRPWWNSSVQVIADQRMVAVAIRYQ
jgi:hypothetical protein